jgi:Holliday junction resolvasome RuvABC endonuclease subunit
MALKKIIGLDLSLTSTGISVSGTTSAILTGYRGAERLHHISSAIIKICKEENVDLAIIEGYSFASRNSQAHSIGELGGCVRMRLWEEGIPFVDVPPTCRAKFATGKGNSSKNEVISSISAKTGIVWGGSSASDMCDAWILEQMALAQFGNSQYDWTKEQLSSLLKVDWSPALEN